ncbi:hypothetical protein RvY_17984 [Ramazzottius varieornatus]|uniref:Protein rolling stone n=1 Tax=Ramazzottius varieornatus TaxID=947166 RepID=A0A1D1W462_RAMVA|nr:hypothetical protein RvY_17984 [Ramazzottius varieornatus]
MAEATGKGRWGALWRNEFRSSRLGLRIHHPSLFTRPQWSAVPDMALKVWKVVLFMYFLAWLIVSVEDSLRRAQTQQQGDRWMIYLTHWTYLLFIFYLLFSALNTCFEIGRRGHEKQQYLILLKIQWVLWNIAAPCTLMVVFLYWFMLWPPDPEKDKTWYKPGDGPSAITLHVHLINGLILVLDHFLHAQPVNLLHLCHPMIYGCLYATFTGIYYAASGTTAEGDIAIYPFLNYKHKLPIAVGVTLALIFIAIPITFAVFWLIFRLRLWLWRRNDSHTKGIPDADFDSVSGTSVAGEPPKLHNVKF